MLSQHGKEGRQGGRREWGMSNGQCPMTHGPVVAGGVLGARVGAPLGRMRARSGLSDLIWRMDG